MANMVGRSATKWDWRRPGGKVHRAMRRRGRAFEGRVWRRESW